MKLGKSRDHMEEAEGASLQNEREVTLPIRGQARDESSPCYKVCTNIINVRRQPVL